MGVSALGLGDVRMGVRSGIAPTAAPVSFPATAASSPEITAAALTPGSGCTAGGIAPSAGNSEAGQNRARALGAYLCCDRTNMSMCRG